MAACKDAPMGRNDWTIIITRQHVLLLVSVYQSVCPLSVLCLVNGHISSKCFDILVGV